MKFHSTQTDSPGNWKGELDEIQLAPAGANGGVFIFAESINSRSGKILAGRVPAVDCNEPIADWRNLHYVDSGRRRPIPLRSEEHTSELQSLRHLVCRLLLEKKN